MVRAGFTDEEIEVLKDWKQFADKRVEKSLYFQALKGNTTAMIFWLKNRQPDQWRDRHEVVDPEASRRYDNLMDKIHAMEKNGQGLETPADMDDGQELRYNGKGASLKH